MDAPAVEAPSFVRGSGAWQGVVLIERPKPPHPDMSVVMSARSIRYDGKRAVVCELPWSFTKQFFKSDDGVVVYYRAETKDGGLAIYERASHREFFLHHGED